MIEQGVYFTDTSLNQ